jgi:hypothetical protein
MTNTRTKSDTAPSARTIGVYQRLVPGKAPSRVQILRSSYSSTKADGKTFGRTTNTYLHSVASGTSLLAPDDKDALRALALTDAEIEAVDTKLRSLVEPARRHAALYRRAAVTQCVQQLATLVAEDVECRSVALHALNDAFGMLLSPSAAQNSEVRHLGVASDGMAHSMCRSPLDAASDVLDQACKAIVEEAKQHRDAGVRLTSQRSIETSAAPAANALDRLQARANRIRRESFPAFEAACKVAGLMVSKSST